MTNNVPSNRVYTPEPKRPTAPGGHKRPASAAHIPLDPANTPASTKDVYMPRAHGIPCEHPATGVRVYWVPAEAVPVEGRAAFLTAYGAPPKGYAWTDFVAPLAAFEAAGCELDAEGMVVDIPADLRERLIGFAMSAYEETGKVYLVHPHSALVVKAFAEDRQARLRTEAAERERLTAAKDAATDEFARFALRLGGAAERSVREGYDIRAAVLANIEVQVAEAAMRVPVASFVAGTAEYDNLRIEDKPSPSTDAFDLRDRLARRAYVKPDSVEIEVGRVSRVSYKKRPPYAKGAVIDNLFTCVPVFIRSPITGERVLFFNVDRRREGGAL